MSVSEHEAALAGLDERAIRVETIRPAMHTGVPVDWVIAGASAIARFILTGETVSARNGRPQV